MARAIVLAFLLTGGATLAEPSGSAPASVSAKATREIRTAVEK